MTTEIEQGIPMNVEPSSHIFDAGDLDAIGACFHTRGFVGVSGAIPDKILDDLTAAHDALDENGSLNHSAEETLPNRDIIFTDPCFLAPLQLPTILDLCRQAFHSDNFELLDSRINTVPVESAQHKGVQWHQDFVFFPHTNFDFISVNIHLDDEPPENAPLMFVSGSHTRGELQHEKDGVFTHVYCGPENFDDQDPVTLCLKRGTVTMHHSLVMHRSQPKAANSPRRQLIYNIRMRDAIQLAGPITRSTGYQIIDGPPTNVARFPDGSVVHLRGPGGRLYDLYGRLAPDR